MKTPERPTPHWLIEMRGGSARKELTVSEFFPVDFAKFCRVFNPARAAGFSRSWAKIAGSTTITGRTQWRDIADQSGATDLPRLDPAMGGIDPVVAAVLASVLREHTQTPDSVYFLAWEGYAGLKDSYRVSDTVVGPYGRRLHWLRGSLADMGPSMAARESELPLWWIPEDCSWSVGNDIYARSVYVGGSASCIDDVLHESRLESVPVPASHMVAAEDE
jgi:hypothetical protein